LQAFGGGLQDLEQTAFIVRSCGELGESGEAAV
jgi:hypothetical protein